MRYESLTLVETMGKGRVKWPDTLTFPRKTKQKI